MSKHTPGPLFVKETSEEGQYSIANITRGVEGQWEDIYVSFGGYFGSYGPHMFAAAPAMLEALQMVARANGAALRGYELDEVRAALAKASPSVASVIAAPTGEAR